MKLPICPWCPNCGSREFQSVRPAGFVAFRNDRQCAACNVRYALPTPKWAAFTLIAIGFIVFAACSASVIIAIARGWIIGLPLNLIFALLGILSLRQGVLSLREEIAVVPNPIGPEPVAGWQALKQWLRTNRSKLKWIAVAAVFLLGSVALVQQRRSAEQARAARQRAAVKMLKDLGGDVGSTVDDRPVDISLQRSESNRIFTGQHTALREIRDEDVAIIALFPDLERLSINSTEISDAGLRQMSPQPKLTAFSVNCPLVSEEGLISIAGMDKLQSLNLAGTGIRSLTAFEFSRKPQLTRLDLSGTLVTSDAAADLKGLQALEELDLSATRVDDGCCKILAQLPKLRDLRLSDTYVTNRGILALQPLSTLVLLDVSNTNVNQQGADALNQHLPNCTILLR